LKHGNPQAKQFIASHPELFKDAVHWEVHGERKKPKDKNRLIKSIIKEVEATKQHIEEEQARRMAKREAKRAKRRAKQGIETIQPMMILVRLDA
jgi:hypothetical protein